MIKKSLFPTWNETFSIPLLGGPPTAGDAVLLEMWDEEYGIHNSRYAHSPSMLRNDFMGQFSFALDTIARTPYKGFHPLLSRPGKADKVSGELNVELWLSDVPAVAAVAVRITWLLDVSLNASTRVRARSSALLYSRSGKAVSTR